MPLHACSIFQQSSNSYISQGLEAFPCKTLIGKKRRRGKNERRWRTLPHEPHFSSMDFMVPSSSHHATIFLNLVQQVRGRNIVKLRVMIYGRDYEWDLLPLSTLWAQISALISLLASSLFERMVNIQHVKKSKEREEQQWWRRPRTQRQNLSDRTSQASTADLDMFVTAVRELLV